MTSILSPVSLTSYYRPEDGSVVQAKLYFYSAGTLDPIAVHTDSLLTIPHSQPVLSGGSGRVPPVFVGEVGTYRVRTFDEFDSLIEDIDGLPSAGGDVEAAPPLDVDPLRLIPTGAIFDFPEIGNAKNGWVRCNGGTIGPPGSGATENASASAEALFKYLWQDPNAVVQPSRGASSAGDWADITTYKRIVVPDYRGRFRATIDAFGRPAADRLAGATFSFLTAVAVGANGGIPAITLTVANLPTHSHTATQAAHSHTGTTPDHYHSATASSGIESADHTHTGYTNSDGAHTHSVPQGGGSGAAAIGSGAGTWAATGAQTTGSAGAHTHTVTTYGRSAAHTHAITVNVYGADRSLAFTTSSVTPAITVNPTTGGDQAFSITPPFQLVATYIKL